MSVLLRTAAARTIVRPPLAARRTLVTLTERIYEAQAIASGPGRNGSVKSSSAKPLELKMTTPKALGGPESEYNPEQLYAMGYASCFSGALNLVCSKAGQPNLAKDAKVEVKVWLGKTEPEGFGIEAEVKVHNFPDEELIKKAHEVCPYSRLMREGGNTTASKA